MANGVHSYQPRIQVTLVKCVLETDGKLARYVSANNRVDLTGFLSDNGSVITHKDITQPLGTFSITFADKVDQKLSDTRTNHAESVYGLVAPMDYVEIRMAREPFRYQGQELPIVMRGFVSVVKRTQQIGPDGTPVRAVTIQGQDFGKLLEILQVFYERNYALGQNLVTQFRLSTNFGVKFTAHPAAEFIATVVDNIVQPAIDQLWQKSALSSTVPRFLRKDMTVSQGIVQPYVWQSYQGNLWGLLRDFADLPWNELFIDDRKDGPTMVYRPLPFKDIDGRIIPPASDPGTVQLTPGDVRALEVGRTDANVANYFWVDAPQYQAIGTVLMQDYAASLKERYLMEDYPNNDYQFFGIRRMQAQTLQGPTDETTAGVDGKPAVIQKSVQNMYDWLAERRGLLKAYNKDNVLFENGTIDLKGNEAVQAGKYLRLDYGMFQAEYYAQAVTQTFVPFRQFTTKARVIRGTGYIERTKLDRSPYFAERGGGAYG